MKAMSAPEMMPAGSRSVSRWFRRLGVLGVAFFLVKGLAWLAVPALLAYMGYR
jgi:hypothetical protein